MVYVNLRVLCGTSVKISRKNHHFYHFFHLQYDQFSSMQYVQYLRSGFEKIVWVSDYKRQRSELPKEKESKDDEHHLR